MFDTKSPSNLDNIRSHCITNENDLWKQGMTQKLKLRTYIKFKDNYDTEDYVKYCLSRRQRSLLAQFRAGILPLHIETGRFKGKDITERICFVCNSDEVEDEFHFLSKCTKYINVRNVMYNNVIGKKPEFEQMNDNDKFVYLMKYEWKLVSVYIDKAWNIRNNVIYKNRDSTGVAHVND